MFSFYVGGEVPVSVLNDIVSTSDFSEDTYIRLVGCAHKLDNTFNFDKLTNGHAIIITLPYARCKLIKINGVYKCVSINVYYEIKRSQFISDT